MGTPLWISVIVITLVTVRPGVAQTPSATSSLSRPGQVNTAGANDARNSVSLKEILESVARKSGKRIVADPRMPDTVDLYGQVPSGVTYEDLVTILHVYGFATVEANRYVEVIPDAAIRAQPLPIVTGKERIADDQYVTGIIHVSGAPAALRVPILRPLLPQNGHLAADVCSNDLIVVDTFANYKRIQAIVRALDQGEPYKPRPCELPDPSSHHD